MIEVYFESKIHAEIVATFDTEDLYIQCLPILEAEAHQSRMFITDRVIDKELTPTKD